MTVSSETAKSGPYSGNGATTVFAYGFRILAAGDLQVILTAADGTQTVQALTTNYTVSGVGADNGGSITMLVAPAAGQKLTIVRNPSFLQATSLETQGAYKAKTVEKAFDQAAMRDLKLRGDLLRALKIPESDVLALSDLPSAAARAGRIISFDADGQVMAVLTPQDLMTVGVGNVLDSTLLRARAAVPSGADLNTYGTTGLYVVMSAVAASIINGPGAFSGILRVETTADTAAIWQTYHASGGIWQRRYSGTTWGAWAKQYDSGNFVPNTDYLPAAPASLTLGESTPRSYTLKTRAQVTTYPVPYMRPTQVNLTMAFDLMPNGSPSGTFKTWFDACNTDIDANPANPQQGARMGATQFAATFGSFNFNGATALPLLFQVGQATSVMQLNLTELLIGKGTLDNGATAGHELWTTGALISAVSGNAVAQFNRITNDGPVVLISQDGSIEGTISVSGTTVAYTSFCGAHVSQLDGQATPALVPGTILESIDDMCEWRMEEWTEVRPAWTEEHPHSKRSNSTVKVEHPEEIVRRRQDYFGPLEVGATFDDEQGRTHSIVKNDNEQLPRCKVSDVAGSRSVYGVFMGWDKINGTEDLDGDMQVASLGAFKIRVGKGVAVARGDLIESAGDGTGRVQADDLMRSCTVGKVTSTMVIETFPDGSYTVPCTLHCG